MPARVADDPLVVIRVVYVERDEVAVVVSAVAAVGETVLLVVDVVQLPADVAAHITSVMLSDHSLLEP